MRVVVTCVEYLDALNATLMSVDRGDAFNFVFYAALFATLDEYAPLLDTSYDMILNLEPSVR